MNFLPDLASLPAPAVVESLDFETILQTLLADFASRYPDYTALLESDPAIKLLEVAAYREVLLRQRINQAARANLIAFATGTDLDHLAAFYGLPRQTDEQDARLRQRAQLRIASLAAHGTAEHYRLLALTASAHVLDVALRTLAPGRIELVLLVDLPEHASDALATVADALQADSAVTLGVEIGVRLANWRPVTIRAQLYRLPDAPLHTVDRVAQTLPGALAAQARIGRDLPRSWLMAQLHQHGIAHVDLLEPATDLVIADDEILAPGHITLIDAGVRR